MATIENDSRDSRNNFSNNSNNSQIIETEIIDIDNNDNTNNIHNNDNVDMPSNYPYTMHKREEVRENNNTNEAIPSNHSYASPRRLEGVEHNNRNDRNNSDAYSKLAARTTQRMPSGNNTQDASKKLSEKSSSNEVSNIPSNTNNVKENNVPNSKVGNGPTKESPKNDPATQKLQKTKANRVSNLLKNRKRKKSSESKDSNNTNDESNNNENSDSETSDGFKTDDLVSKAMKKIRIKIVIGITIIMVAILFIVSSFLAIFGINVQFGIPAASQSSYGTSEFSSVYEKGTAGYENEISYYKALKKANKDYADKHGESLKTNYIHSVLIYVYYQIDIDEDDLENIDEENLENNNSSSDENDTISINYKAMESKINTVVELMTPSDSSKNIDYEKNGEFYDKLKNSNFFKDYYKNTLKEKDIDELLDEIFDLAAAIDDIEFDDDVVISSETSVTVNHNSNGSYSSSSTVSKLSMNDYLSGSIYANNSISNSEKNKALTIAYTTNLVATNPNLTITNNNASASNSVCNVKLGCSYDINGNLVDGPGEQSNQNTINYRNGYYYKPPLSDEQIANLNNDINSVYGKVLVNTNGTYPQLDIETIINSLGDGTYQEILKDTYGKYDIKDVSEDSYMNDDN